MRTAILIWAMGLGGLGAVPVSAQNACYTQSDCECAASENNLRNGLWHAKTEPGTVSASNGRVFELNTAEAPLDIISECDGTLFIQWDDVEAGRINWELRRVNQGAALADTGSAAGGLTSILPQLETSVWDEFTGASPELYEFASANEFYYGETFYNFSGGSVLATMLLGYVGLPGRENTHGDVSITIKIGPFQGHTLWMRTGHAQFEWVGSSDASFDHIYEVCRCQDVTLALESASLGARLQKALVELHQNRQKRKIGYDFLAGTTTMHNEVFDQSDPWVKPTATDPGNWPCLAPNQMQLDGSATQTQFQTDFNQQWGPIRDRILGQAPAGSGKSETAAETKYTTCKIVPPNADVCVSPEVEQRSFLIHEQVHQQTCLDYNGQAQIFKDQIAAALTGNTDDAFLTRKEAEAAALDEADQCLTYAAYMTNAFNAATDELKAYTASIPPLKEHLAKYCTK